MSGNWGHQGLKGVWGGSSGKGLKDLTVTGMRNLGMTMSRLSMALYDNSVRQGTTNVLQVKLLQAERSVLDRQYKRTHATAQRYLRLIDDEMSRIRREVDAIDKKLAGLVVGSQDYHDLKDARKDLQGQGLNLSLLKAPLTKGLVINSMSTPRDTYMERARQFAKAGSATTVQDLIYRADALAPVTVEELAELQGLLNAPAPVEPLERVYEERRYFSEDERTALAKSGNALPDGSFPIVNLNDLKNAIQAYGRASNKEQAKAHITKRAEELGATNELPESWSVERSEPLPDWYVNNYWVRQAAAIADRELMGTYHPDNPIQRTDGFSSIAWAELPPVERTLGAAVRRREIHRNYEQAADNMKLSGWEAKPIVPGRAELQFTGRDVNGVFRQAILIRPVDGTIFKALEVSTPHVRPPQGSARYHG
jgi:hypothetical protein